MHPPSKTFAKVMRDRQLAWARDGNLTDGVLEERHGKLSWVLKRTHQRSNLFLDEWWTHIAGREHRWARALNSSQCFAVNLFGPLAKNNERARRALQRLLPSRVIGLDDTISVEFEFTPPGARDWLGEKGQPTQIDVYFKIERSGQCVGHVLVEVKFTETGFGCCRGWKGKSRGQWLNPDRARCRNVSAIVANPKVNCWLASPQGEARRYWEIISRPDSSLRESAIRAAGECPFRYGLYQMMRNRLLGDELVRHTRASWADFIVCHHPDNKAILELEEAVSVNSDAVTAFRSLSSDDSVHVWNAADVVEKIRSIDNQLATWESWMHKRYFDSGTVLALK